MKQLSFAINLQVESSPGSLLLYSIALHVIIWQHGMRRRRGEREERVRVRKKKAPTFEQLPVERAGGRGGIWRRYPRGFSLEIAFLPFSSQLLRKKTLTPTWGLGGGGDVATGATTRMPPYHYWPVAITKKRVLHALACWSRGNKIWGGWIWKEGSCESTVRLLKVWWTLKERLHCSIEPFTRLAWLFVFFNYKNN